MCEFSDCNGGPCGCHDDMPVPDSVGPKLAALAALAARLTDELSRGDWEGCTCREIVLEMYDVLYAGEAESVSIG